MNQMTLSQVCKKYGFTRRVIQGYEKEGLIKHTGKNKYGHLLYDENQVKKIAYIRYLQINGLTLKEISNGIKRSNKMLISAQLIHDCNDKHKRQIKKLSKLIRTNNHILYLLMDKKNTEEILYDTLMEDLKNEKEH